MIAKNHLDAIIALRQSGKINEEIQGTLFQLADAANESTDGEEAAGKLSILLEVYADLPKDTFSNSGGNNAEVTEEEGSINMSVTETMQLKLDRLSEELERDRDERADEVVDELQPHLAKVK